MTRLCTWPGHQHPDQVAGAELARSSPADVAREYAAAAMAPNTERAYQLQWRLFVEWCNERNFFYLPAEPSTVANFIGYQAAAGMSPASIDVALAAISKRHELGKLPSPRDSVEVSIVRAGIRWKHGTAQVGRAALTVEVLRDLVRSMPTTIASPACHYGIRDRALLLVGFAGALRRSELVSLNWGDVEFLDRGMMLTIRQSKTDQEGKGRLVGIAHGKVLMTCPVNAMQALSVLFRRFGDEKPKGAVFRSFASSGPSHRLFDGDVGRILKRHLVAVGYDARGYGAHSLRVGFVTAAIAAGKSRTAIKRQTGHRSDEMVDRYARPVELFDDNPSDWIGL